MLMKTKQRDALARTLDLAGLGSIKADKINCLALADPKIEQNERVHRATNNLIMDLMREGNVGRCIHVTGEMRALLDPFHRDLCAQMHRLDGRQFSILYNLPPDRRNDRYSAIGWSLNKWSEKGQRTWQEYLRTFDVIAERVVDIRASKTESPVQYSVFGSKFVQLQEKHRDAQQAKRVWLLESSELNEALTDHGERMLAEAQEVDERWYGGFVTSLGDLGARSVLRKLSAGHSFSTEELDDETLRSFNTSPLDSAKALKTMGFAVADEKDRWTISKPGREYTELLLRS
jgi:hypothetical protein